MERDFSFPPFMDYGMVPPQGPGPDMGDMYKDPVFNPMMQYEQAYMYYRYQSMQMEYKIKCKEYERLCGNESNRSHSSSNSSEKSNRRVE